MRINALAAILFAIPGDAVAAAAIDDSVERAITKKAIEIFGIQSLVTRKIAAFVVTKIPVAFFWHFLLRLLFYAVQILPCAESGSAVMFPSVSMPRVSPGFTVRNLRGSWPPASSSAR